MPSKQNRCRLTSDERLLSTSNGNAANDTLLQNIEESVQMQKACELHIALVCEIALTPNKYNNNSIILIAVQRQNRHSSFFILSFCRLAINVCQLDCMVLLLLLFYYYSFNNVTEECRKNGYLEEKKPTTTYICILLAADTGSLCYHRWPLYMR